MTDEEFSKYMNPPEGCSQSIKWNKVNLRTKNKNLPPVGKRVTWATTEGSIDGKIFHKFFGQLEKDEKYIDYGYGRYKITSNYYWIDLEDPEA